MSSKARFGGSNLCMCPSCLKACPARAEIRTAELKAMRADVNLRPGVYDCYPEGGELPEREACVVEEPEMDPNI